MWFFGFRASGLKIITRMVLVMLYVARYLIDNIKCLKNSSQSRQNSDGSYYTKQDEIYMIHTLRFEEKSLPRQKEGTGFSIVGEV